MSKISNFSLALIFASLSAVLLPLQAAEAEEPRLLGPKIFDDTNFFPIAVWVQQPRNAERFKAAGINMFVGLWRGPNQEQLDALTKAGMYVICSQNRFGLENKDHPAIAGWMHGDEPDNAQALPEGKGWGPPILPSKIVEDYQKLRAADPSRPVLLNLGQGVAWDNWIGRGVRRNHPEDYPEYVKGADIVSFDIYPAVHDNAEVAGKLEFVARGVERLVKWTDGKKRVWNCIECTHISNPSKKATPHEIRAEVWMALIHGSRGLIYFVHQFEPRFIEAALLEDPENLAAVTKINKQIQELAPVLNSPSIFPQLETRASENVRIATMSKRIGTNQFLFAVGMENKPTVVTFKAADLRRAGKAEVLGEQRSVGVTDDGLLRDEFRPYQVHLYKFTAPQL